MWGYQFRLIVPDSLAWSQVGISAKEMLPIVLAAGTWGASWHGQQVTFFTDNLAVVAVVQQRSTRDPVVLNVLQCLCFYAAYCRWGNFRCSFIFVVNA